MKVEFIGTYVKHEIKKTKTDKDYCKLICKENLSNKTSTIFIFDSKVFNNLAMFKPEDGITVIFETWYNVKTKSNVIIVKDIVGY